MQLGGRRKLSIHNLLQEISHYLYNSFSCILHCFLTFVIKIIYKIKQATDQRLYLKFGFMNIAYNKHEMNGGFDFPSCLKEFITTVLQEFPTQSAPNFLQIQCQSLELDLFKNV